MKTVKILAGIVTFNPDLSRLRDNVEAILPQVDTLVIVDNGSDNEGEIATFIQQFERTHLVSLKENLGIATALNVIGDVAIERSFDYFLMLDQDSVVKSGLVAEYKKYLHLENLGLLACERDDRNYQVRQTIEGEYREVDKAITSGTLMPTSVFASGIRHDDTFFIDLVDHEIDIHLLKKGYKIYKLSFVGLLHELGETVKHETVIRSFFTGNHSAIRRYYFSRNCVLLIKKWGWSKLTYHFFKENIKMMIKVVLAEDDKMKKISYSFKGMWHGLIGKSGKYEPKRKA
ncbi:rhamnosyltransferase [Pilibacter termitis]|uniref:Rhamnosyltransferase n=1 Tax=Pilibacter termitis TaxID=263852 RepID=A0A1T4P9D9_9ENTE|nr:glycosyltransferase [Pilibacter termitis]SJZ87937.1 rhamnosyltransferase [Pilibacter termitis]